MLSVFYQFYILPEYTKKHLTWVPHSLTAASCDLDVHKGRNKETAEPSSRHHLDTRLLQSVSIIRTTQHSEKLVNGREPSRDFSIFQVVFHNLGQ